MTVCKLCNREMHTAQGCVKVLFKYKDGKTLDPIKFGHPGDLMYTDTKQCHDCNCKVGHYHHSGCDAEACPRCRGQAISCDCKMDGNY